MQLVATTNTVCGRDGQSKTEFIFTIKSFSHFFILMDNEMKSSAIERSLESNAAKSITLPYFGVSQIFSGNQAQKDNDNHFSINVY